MDFVYGISETIFDLKLNIDVEAILKEKYSVQFSVLDYMSTKVYKNKFFASLKATADTLNQQIQKLSNWAALDEKEIKGFTLKYGISKAANNDATSQKVAFLTQFAQILFNPESPEYYSYDNALMSDVTLVSE